MTAITSALAMLWGIIHVSTAAQSIDSHLFESCEKGLVQNNQLQDEYTGNSYLECMLKCGQTSGCQGVNVCPGEVSRQVKCTLTGEGSPGSCDGLAAATSPLCFHAVKGDHSSDVSQAPGSEGVTDTEELVSTTPIPETTSNTPTQTTTEITCGNGGTPNGDRCQCPIDKGGKTCQREIRDCLEVYDNGYVDAANNNYYDIKPLGSAGSVQVKCEIENGTMATYPLMSTNMALNRDWNNCRDGWEDALGTQPNYFIGLVNLFHLLKQAEYDLNIRFVYRENNNDIHVVAIYRNFSIGLEAESFELGMYASFDDRRSTAQNGFSMYPPIKFSANAAPRIEDRVCYNLRNGAGWYGENCTGYGLFGSNKIWPVNGANVTFEQVYFNFIRRSGFYDE
ncbi:uncharacterized protein [Littorina saxatilis]|uniref:uncharacterized protein n=1 Tax=Littorina saxatilis TaxID=31220 RepID=UPI0038B59AE1